MTETSPVELPASTADDPLERRVSTVGRIQPHVEVKDRSTPRAVSCSAACRANY